MRLSGTLWNWNSRDAYGYIARHDCKGDVKLHKSTLRRCLGIAHCSYIGCRYSFTTERSPEGTLIARNIEEMKAGGE